MIVGFAAGVILLLLALTSTHGWQKRLGTNWKRLHYLAYAAGILVVVHFLWLVKDTRVPLRYAGVLAILLLLRAPPVKRLLARVRRRDARGDSVASSVGTLRVDKKRASRAS